MIQYPFHMLCDQEERSGFSWRVWLTIYKRWRNQSGAIVGILLQQPKDNRSAEVPYTTMEEMTLQYSSQDLEAVDGSSEILRRTVTCTVEAVDVEAEETVPGPLTAHIRRC